MKEHKGRNIRGVSGLTIKTLAIICAVALVLSTAVSGTYAWLLTKTEPVVNTFTFGAIDIELTESDSGDGDNDPNTNTYELMPGGSVTKDPKVTVIKGSEACWLYVKLDESENFDQFLTYEVAEGWSIVEGQTNVFARSIERIDEDKSFEILKDNEVKVKGDVTAQMINELVADTYPTLELTAYAVQMSEEIDSAEDGWKLVVAEITKEE